MERFVRTEKVGWSNDVNHWRQKCCLAKRSGGIKEKFADYEKTNKSLVKGGLMLMPSCW